jgi:hypothetical protein
MAPKRLSIGAKSGDGLEGGLGLNFRWRPTTQEEPWHGDELPVEADWILWKVRGNT